jgi:hypothetical protein
VTDGQCKRAKEPISQPSLDRFRVRSVIDWMGFRVTLKSPSQFRHLQQRMLEVWGRIYFEPDEGAASSHSFTFKLNDPPSPDQFMAELQSMAAPGQPPILDGDVDVIGIEVAIDAYIEGSDREALAWAVTYFLRHQANPPSGPPRITAKDKPPFRPGLSEDVFQAILDGGVTINGGERNSDYRSRFYLKDYDSFAGTAFAPLPPEQWRARFENTLTGGALPFTTIDGWRSCAFEKALSSRFALVKSVAPEGSLNASMEAHLLQLGRRPDSQRRRASDRRQRRPYVRRDSTTNDRIRQALRRLTKSQSRRNSVKVQTPFAAPHE